VAGFHRDPLGELTALLQTHQLVFGVRKEDQKKRGKEGGREGKGKGGREEESEGERGLTMFRGVLRRLYEPHTLDLVITSDNFFSEIWNIEVHWV